MRSREERSCSEGRKGGFKSVIPTAVKGEKGGSTYFGGFVLGGGDEVGAVRGHLEVCDLHAVFVGGLVDEELAGLGGGLVVGPEAVGGFGDGVPLRRTD